MQTCPTGQVSVLSSKNLKRLTIPILNSWCSVKNCGVHNATMGEKEISYSLRQTRRLGRDTCRVGSKCGHEHEAFQSGSN
nr:hypothetical transcript [Hymenolepis microstoma]